MSGEWITAVIPPQQNRVYQVRSPRTDWIEVDAQEFARIKDIRGFDWRILCLIEQHEEG